MLEHLRFTVLPLAMVAAIVSMVVGGHAVWFATLFFIGVNLVADEFGEDYLARATRPRTGFLEAVLWSAPPLLLVLLLVALARVAAPGSPLSAMLPQAAGGAFEWLGAASSYGVVCGLLAVSFAHEQIHRRPLLSRLVGQAMLALCLHPAVAVEHVHGHHVYACTRRDPAFAPRGVSYWRFLGGMWLGENRSAARFERRRLARRGIAPASVRNRFLSGWAMTAAIFALAGALAGAPGLALVAAGGAIGLAMIGLGSYVTHYGLLRMPGEPMRDRHSWSAPRLASTSVLLNAPRHARHHALATEPFWRLTVSRDSPRLPHGISIMSVIALAPPIWFAMTDPLLDEWLAHAATPQEPRLPAAGGQGSPS